MRRSVSAVRIISNSHMYMRGQKNHLLSVFYMTLGKYQRFSSIAAHRITWEAFKTHLCPDSNLRNTDLISLKWSTNIAMYSKLPRRFYCTARVENFWHKQKSSIY